MSEPVKNPGQVPESYNPKDAPELMKALAAQAQLEEPETPKVAARTKGGKTMIKLQNMRVIEIPPFRAVSSGPDAFTNIFGEGGFDQWMQAHGHLCKDMGYAHPDFMWHEEDNIDKSVWIWAIKDDVTEEDCVPYEIITFEGGMYLVATGNEDDPKDLSRTVRGMERWINRSDAFVSDHRSGHYGMCHMTGCGVIQQALGFAQQEIFLPIRLKKKESTS